MTVRYFPYSCLLLITELYFVHSDLRVGFAETFYTVAESAGVLILDVRAIGNHTDVGLPLGVRITSKDRSAVGKAEWL